MQSDSQYSGRQGIIWSATNANSDDAAVALEQGRRAVRLDNGKVLCLKTGHFNPVAYAVRFVDGKGMGVVATRDITCGERLIAEPPLLTFCSSSTEEYEQSAVTAVDNLPKSERAVFDSLYNAKIWPNDCHPHSEVLGIVATNCIEVTDLSVSGIFATISRFNHSCAPNVEWRWNDSIKAETIHANRDIACGEELCVSYLESHGEDPSLCSSRDVRCAYLKETWGFVCSCSVCTLTGEELTKSDKRRRAIVVLDEKIEEAAFQAMQQNADAGGESLVEERLQLLKEECLNNNSERRRSMFHAFGTCTAVGRYDRARKWLEMAIDHEKLSAGTDSQRYKWFQSCLRELTSQDV